VTNDEHARPAAAAEEPLYDPDIPTPSHGERARTLAAQAKTATLGTICQAPEGYPYTSFVTAAFDDGDPVFLISGLAEHTKNLARDDRASLLVAESVAEDPLANGRVTLLGPCTRLAGDGGSARDAFLAAHPNASYYADFRDFAFWKLRVESVRYIGGYGRMSWVSAEDWRSATADPLGGEAQGILEHMNQDHADALVTYCLALSRATDVSAATMTGVDRYGFEMSAVTAKGPRPVRIAFPQTVSSSEEVRRVLIELLRDARARLSG